jgi:ribose 5-phosphate isomerase A
VNNERPPRGDRNYPQERKKLGSQHLLRLENVRGTLESCTVSGRLIFSIMAHDQEKKAAARASLGFVRDENIVGLGSGSTAEYAVRLLGERVQAGLKIRGIPTSQRTRELAESVGIPLSTLEEFPDIDVTIDGADEIDPELQLIKGGGGALLREKIVASASKRMVVIADSSKRVQILGKFPLPVEVIALAQPLLKKKIAALGATVKLRQYAHGDPFVTDEGHHILDCQFGEILDPRALARQLDSMPGIVEHGLFVDMATLALIGKDDGVVEFRRNPH